MIKTKITAFSTRLIYVFAAAAILLAYCPSIASAAQITSRSVVIGSSVAGATTTYTFSFTVPSSTILQSASFTACTTASGDCTAAPGFSASSSSLTSQPTNLGDASGWTVNTSTTNSLRLSKTGNSTAPTGSQTVGFSGVVNPSTTNSTFYIRMVTYSDDAWTTEVDSGVVATSTAGQVTVTATVDETLTFTLASTSVPLGILSSASTGTGTSSMTVATNAASGYTLSYTGDTLTSGSNTITAMSAATTSAMDSKQFGINLMANTTPSVGSNVTGTGTGAPLTGYDTQNTFKFDTSGDTVASASAPTNSNTFTVSYIANIDGSTAAGAYSTVITYTAVANF